MSNVSPSLERKLICGKMHVRVMCNSCKGMCWTVVPPGGKHKEASAAWVGRYVCDTCNPRAAHESVGVGRGTNVADMEE